MNEYLCSITETMTISAATIKDIPELVSLVNSAYRGDSSKKGWTTEADLLAGVRIVDSTLLEQMETPGQYFLKTVDDNEHIIGCVSLLEKDDTIYLGMLTVKPDIQATGIGKTLLEASEAFARKLGKLSIEMTVITKRTELIEWYQRRGYSKTGEFRPFPTDPKFGIQKESLEFLVLKKGL
jgi:ribosomal protein S18 acetylase RimI-like enzyme